MAFCTHCGTQVPDGARFCPGCGKEVAGVAATPRARDAAAAPTTPGDRPATFEDPPSRGGGMSALAILALIAVVVVAVVLWQQRDGARPVAGGDNATAIEDGGGDTKTVDDEPTAVTGGDTPAAPVATGGDEAAAGDGTSTGTSDDQPDGVEQPDTGSGEVIPAAAIDSAFSSDRIEAATQYPGPVTVRGEIVSTSQVGDIPSVGMAGRTRFNSMVVNFAPDQRRLVEAMFKGQVITVRCSNAGSLAGTTILRDCRY